MMPTLNIRTKKTTIRSIRSTDPRFKINDGIVITNRAGFEINHNCPENYKAIISECMRVGWLAPVAYMTEREMMISGLLQDTPQTT